VLFDYGYDVMLTAMWGVGCVGMLGTGLILEGYRSTKEVRHGMPSGPTKEHELYVVDSQTASSYHAELFPLNRRSIMTCCLSEKWWKLILS
jgi:hypothetical protein